MTEPTTTDLAIRDGGALAASGALPLDRNPAVVYLSQLAPGSRRTMAAALNAIAGLLGVPELRDADGRDIRYVAAPWHKLQYQHTAAIRAALAETCAPATANKHLAA